MGRKIGSGDPRGQADHMGDRDEQDLGRLVEKSAHGQGAGQAGAEGGDAGDNHEHGERSDDDICDQADRNEQAKELHAGDGADQARRRAHPCGAAPANGGHRPATLPSGPVPRRPDRTRRSDALQGLGQGHAKSEAGRSRLHRTFENWRRRNSIGADKDRCQRGGGRGAARGLRGRCSASAASAEPTMPKARMAEGLFPVALTSSQRMPSRRAHDAQAGAAQNIEKGVDRDGHDIDVQAVDGEEVHRPAAQKQVALAPAEVLLFPQHHGPVNAAEVGPALKTGAEQLVHAPGQRLQAGVVGVGRAEAKDPAAARTRRLRPRSARRKSIVPGARMARNDGEDSDNGGRRRADERRQPGRGPK